MNHESFFRRHALTLYFVLAYLFSWGCVFLLGAPELLQRKVPPAEGTVVVLAGMLVGPMVASLSMTALTGGRAGLRDLAARLGRWRVGVRWYAVALLTLPIISLAALMALSTLVSPAFRPAFKPVGIIFGLLAGFIEELGWTGFALPRMLRQRSVLRAGLLLGVVWAVWHTMADFWGNSVSMGALWLPYFIVSWIAPLIAYRALVAWVYSHTRSLLLAVLMHMAYTGGLYLMGPTLAVPQTMLWYGLNAVALWALVGLLALRGRRAAEAAPTTAEKPA